MSERKLKDISKAMQGIDFAMLFTKTDGGAMAGRPMSNNRDVEYDGDSFYFTYERFRTVSDIERDPKVSLLIRNKGAFEAHWTKDLDRWFEDGIDTPGVVLIKVHATRVHWWDGEDEEESLV